MRNLYINIGLFCLWVLLLWILGLHLITAFIEGIDVSIGMSIGVAYAFSSAWVVLTIGVGLLIFGKR